ncbi:MAG: hypothetical protein H7230_00860 [Candidatus Parcubacteria bacterium]|nr:hypothetical protein [Candidatus Paceibacterota bacterium]
MTTTTKDLATLNIQLDKSLYSNLKQLAHTKQTTLAKLFRDFATQILESQAKQIPKKQITVESSLPIINIKTSNDLYDYNPILTAKNDEIPVFRLPSSIRFQ